MHFLIMREYLRFVRKRNWAAATTSKGSFKSINLGRKAVSIVAWCGSIEVDQTAMSQITFAELAIRNAGSGKQPAISIGSNKVRKLSFTPPKSTACRENASMKYSSEDIKLFEDSTWLKINWINGLQLLFLKHAFCI